MTKITNGGTLACVIPDTYHARQEVRKVLERKRPRRRRVRAPRAGEWTVYSQDEFVVRIQRSREAPRRFYAELVLGQRLIASGFALGWDEVRRRINREIHAYNTGLVPLDFDRLAPRADAA